MMPQVLPTSAHSSITAQYLSNSEVIGIKVTDSTRVAIDAFTELVKAIQQDRPANEITYFLFDFSATMAGFQSPYGRAKTREMVNWRPELVSYTSIVLSRGFVTSIARPILNALGGKTHTLICHSEAEGVVWLEQQRALHGRHTDR
jgi:hypothetical protein